MARKIRAVLMCACLIALCAISAHADAITLSYDTTLRELTAFRFYLNPGETSKNYTVQKSPGTLKVDPAQISYDVDFSPYLYFYENANDTFYYHPDYSYSISYSFTIHVDDYQGSHVIKMPNEPLYFALSPSRYLSSSLQISPNVLFTLDTLSGSDLVASVNLSHSTSASGNRLNHTFTYVVNVAFKLPTDFMDNTFTSFFAPFNLSTLDITGGLYNDVLTVGPTYVISATASYDPSGEVHESDVDRIIEGQYTAIIEGQENEREQVNQAGSDAGDEGQEAASAAFNFSGFSSALGGLVSALGYTGTDFHFYLEAADNIPFIGSLWGTQEIPLKTMIDSLPQGLLYVLRFLAWLALLFSVVHIIKSLINDINGGGED